MRLVRFGARRPLSKVEQRDNMSQVSFLQFFFQLCSVDALRKIVCSEVVQTTLKDRETHEVHYSI
jgi:hypothetical protein